MNFNGFDLHKFERHQNTYIHDIINLLKENGTMSFEDLKNKLKIDLYNHSALNNALVKALKNNQRIIFHENTLSYKHTYAIKSKKDFEDVLTNLNKGLELKDLKDSPVDVMPFINGNPCIIILKDNDNSEIVFYNNFLIQSADEDLQLLWRSIKIPPYQDLIGQLNTIGIKKDKVEHTKRKVIVRKEKSKKYKRKIKITNTHVKGLDLSGMDNQ